MHQYGAHFRTKMVLKRRAYRDEVVLHQFGEFIPLYEACSFIDLSMYERMSRVD